PDDLMSLRDASLYELLRMVEIFEFKGASHVTPVGAKSGESSSSFETPLSAPTMSEANQRQASTASIAACVVRELSAACWMAAAGSFANHIATGARRMSEP